MSTAHLMLAGKDLALLEGMKVDGKVRLIVYGRIARLSQQASENIEEQGASTGLLEVDVTTLKAASNSEIAELFDEDLDG